MRVSDLRRILADAPAEAVVCLRHPNASHPVLLAAVQRASWDWGERPGLVHGQWAAPPEKLDPLEVLAGPSITLELAPELPKARAN